MLPTCAFHLRQLSIVMPSMSLRGLRQESNTKDSRLGYNFLPLVILRANVDTFKSTDTTKLTTRCKFRSRDFYILKLLTSNTPTPTPRLE